MREGTIEKSPLEQKKGDRDRTQERQLRQWLGTVCSTEDSWSGFQGELNQTALPTLSLCHVGQVTSLLWNLLSLSVKCVSGGRERGATRGWLMFYLNDLQRAWEMRHRKEESRRETRKTERIKGRKGKTKIGKEGEKPGRLRKEKSPICLSS